MMALAGARNTHTWQTCVEKSLVPLPSSLAYEGVFNEHFFLTGCETHRILSASFSAAMTKDPISGKSEAFVCLGLNSCFDGEGFSKIGRPALNLVILLDISGSMSDTLEVGKEHQEVQNKLQLAIEAIKVLMLKLGPTDSFGLITFDSQAEVLIPLTPVKDLDVSQVKRILDGLGPRGSTDVSAGLRQAYSIFPTQTLDGDRKKSNRVFVLTDDNTNTGDTSAGSIVSIVSEAADKAHIYTTTIGIGIDFQTDLVQELSSVRACNYLSVKTTANFRRAMDDDFDHLVTPLAFDIVVSMASEAWEPERIFGSPGYEHPGPSGELMRIGTAFPSRKLHRDFTQGGVVLVTLRRRSGLVPGLSSVSGEGDKAAKITVSYEDMEGLVHMDACEVLLPSPSSSLPCAQPPVGCGVAVGEGLGSGEWFGSSCVRKAVALTRYVNLCKRWAASEMAVHAPMQSRAAEVAPTAGQIAELGAGPPPLAAADPGRTDWHGARVPLHVCDGWKASLGAMAGYLERELVVCRQDDRRAAACGLGVSDAASVTVVPIAGWEEQERLEEEWMRTAVRRLKALSGWKEARGGGPHGEDDEGGGDDCRMQ